MVSKSIIGSQKSGYEGKKEHYQTFSLIFRIKIYHVWKDAKQVVLEPHLSTQYTGQYLDQTPNQTVTLLT